MTFSRVISGGRYRRAALGNFITSARWSTVMAMLAVIPGFSFRSGLSTLMMTL